MLSTQPQPGPAGPPPGSSGPDAGRLIAAAILLVGSSVVCLAAAAVAALLFLDTDDGTGSERVTTAGASRPERPSSTPERGSEDPSPLPVLQPMEPPTAGQPSASARGPFDVGAQWTGSLSCEGDERRAGAQLRVISRGHDGAMHMQVSAVRPHIRYMWTASGFYDETTGQARFDFVRWNNVSVSRRPERLDLHGQLDPSGRRFDGRTGDPECPTFVFAR